MIELLSVIKPDLDGAKFLLLDGNLAALFPMELGQEAASCLIARDFETNIYNHRINVLHRICPKAVLLQNHQFTPGMTRYLRKIKAARQIGALELMIAANTSTAAHADVLLKATPLKQRTYHKPQ